MFFNDLDGGTVLCRVAVNGHSGAVAAEKVYAKASLGEARRGKKQKD